MTYRYDAPHDAPHDAPEPEGPLGRVFAMADRARSYTVVGRRPNIVSKVCNTKAGQGREG